MCGMEIRHFFVFEVHFKTRFFSCHATEGGWIANKACFEHMWSDWKKEHPQAEWDKASGEPGETCDQLIKDINLHEAVGKHSFGFVLNNNDYRMHV